MPIEYRSLTLEERNLAIADNIHAREVEHFHYELNRSNYQSLLDSRELSSLPDEWPDELVTYRGLTRDQAITLVRDGQQLATVQALQLRDKLRILVRAEAIERDRVELYHAQLVSQISDATELQSALNAARALRVAGR